MASGDLYSLLGVDADISDDGLRRAYETQVSRAAKEGYQRRVLDLSNALDALPRGRGGVLFPRTSWAGTTRTFTLKLNDQSVHTQVVKF